MNTHLTDDQFTDLLLGAAPASVSAHVDTCPACAQEAARVSSAIGSFEHETRLWSERRASTRPRLARTPTSPLVWLRRPQTWATAAAAGLLAASITLTHRAEAPAPTQQAAIPTASPATIEPQPVADATLKADNDLLSAIDGELSADATPPASMYGLDSDASPHTHKPLKRSSN